MMNRFDIMYIMFRNKMYWERHHARRAMRRERRRVGMSTYRMNVYLFKLLYVRTLKRKGGNI